jgi:hypothetical protein
MWLGEEDHGKAWPDGPVVSVKGKLEVLEQRTARDGEI